jgi:hypothetical protein
METSYPVLERKEQGSLQGQDTSYFLLRCYSSTQVLEKRANFLLLHFLSAGDLERVVVSHYQHSLFLELIMPSASAGFLLGLAFNPEDGDDLFLQNIGLSPN